MKKLDKKGVTLVELIVSFALVAVACVYFYQTLVTVTDLYRLASKETDDFVNEAYTFRILDEKARRLGKLSKFIFGKSLYKIGLSNSINITELKSLGCNDTFLNSIVLNTDEKIDFGDDELENYENIIHITLEFNVNGTTVNKEYYRYLK